MTTLKQKVSLVIVTLSAIVCFTVSFIMGISGVKIFHRKSSSIFNSVNDTLRVKYEITFSSDKQVFPLFPTLLNSIHSNLGLGEFANVHIIAMPDITAEDYSVLSRLNDKLGFSRKLTLFFYPFTYKLKYKQTLKHVSEATMCRLLLPEMLSLRIDKILYVDTDAIVNHSLRQLFKTEIKSDCGVVARSSTNSNIINDWLRKDGLFDHLQYKANNSFNAGVLLLSLNKLRQNDFVNRTLSLVQKWGINDQIALNFYCNGTYDELPMDYNFWAGRDDWRDSVRHKIVHFAGPNKPWKVNYQPYEEQLLWYKYFLSYPHGEKMVPPLRPTYIFLIKHSRGSEGETLTMPDIVLASRKCRYMIHILAINFKGRHKEKIESEIEGYTSNGLWITYSFINDQQPEGVADPDELSGQYALLRLPQIMHEYVERTFLAFDRIPDSDYLCRAESQGSSSKLGSAAHPSSRGSRDAFGAELGLDLRPAGGLTANGSPNESVGTGGMTTTSTPSGRELLRWCIEVSNPLYYLDLNILRTEKRRIEISIKEEHVDSLEILKSECYKISALNKNSTEEETNDEGDVVDDGVDNNDEMIAGSNHIDNKSKLYF